jgi:hypothetical protein
VTKILIEGDKDITEAQAEVLSGVVSDCIRDLMENLNAEIFKEREE